MRRPSDQWPPKRVNQLTALWADGFSASQIADELGGLTRNAVIGKVNRLGLSGRVVSAAPRARRVPSPHGNLGGKRIEAKQTSAALEEAFAISAVRDDDIPQEQRKQFLELKDHHCRWIIGDPGKEGNFYCGGEANVYGGRPYCAAHRMRAKGTAITITEAERLRRTMQGKKNHVTGQAKAA